MSCNKFYMIFASCALRQILTSLTDFSAAFVFPIPISIGGAIVQEMITRTNVCIIVFIIHILMFSEKSIFSHRAFVWKYRCHAIVYKHFRYRRSFITSVNNTVFHSNICKLIIKTFKSSAVMFVSWIYCEIDNPSVFITGSFNPIGKHMLMFALSEPSAFRICCTALNSFSV